MNIPKVASKVLKLPTSITKDGLSIKPNFRFESDYYEIKLGKKLVGNATFQVHGAVDVPIKDLQRELPVDWFQGSKNPKVKPYLDLNYIEITGQKGKGLGRKAVQLLYELSRKTGGEGRIVLDSVPTAAGFYSHLGFDCPIAERIKFDNIYKVCLEFAQNMKMDARTFRGLLTKYGCPSKTNGKFNVAGIRFFNPTKENLAKLFK